jgi:uncharacterized protein
MPGKSRRIDEADCPVNRFSCPFLAQLTVLDGRVMPYFAIHCIDKPAAGDLRAATRGRHLEHVAGAGERLLVAGPLLDDEGAPIGSLLIVDFDDRRAAIQFAADDPYAQAGLFASVAVTSWKKVLPQ